MQLKIQTDYAIRTLFYLTVTNRVVSTKELCENLGIAETYFPKIIVKLREKGYVVSLPGKDGGYRINMKAEDITLFDVVRLMEDTFRLNRCLEDDEFCSRNATENCPVHKFYCRFQKQMEEQFASITIHDLVESA